MKKLFLFAVAAFAMLATSCSKDANVVEPSNEEVTVSFMVNAPEMATRTIADGTTATDLHYAVYSNGEYLQQLSGVKDDFNLSATLKFKLVDGMTYDFIFWAQNPDAPYHFDTANKKVTVNYANMLSNNEKNDAFFGVLKDVTVNGGMQQSVDLYRPFAQLNIAAADYEDAKKSGINVTKTKVTLKTYTTLNLTDGTVDGEVEATYKLNNILTDEFASGYKWLSMNYILVDTKELVNVTFNTDDTKVAEKTWANVPVQRNYRTNIVGNILTSDVDVDINVKPGINDGESISVAEVATAQSLQEAINDPDTDMITLTDDIDLNDLFASLTATRAGSTNTLYVVNGRELKLNLNGFELSGVDESTASYALIDNKGKLTILNSNTEKEGKITLSATNNRYWNAYSSVISNNPGGELTIEDGVVIEHLGGTDMAYGIDNLTNGPGTSAITTVNGGKIISKYIAIRQFLNGVEATNKLVINGGELSSTRDGHKYSIYFQNPSSKPIEEHVSSGELIIGEKAAIKHDIYIDKPTADCKVEVAEAAMKDGATFVTESETYKIANVDGVYTLADAAVATIGETKYYSFDAAFEAAQSGDTIVLVDNAEATTDMTYVLGSGKTLNLELGGYTLYAENTRTETHNFLIDVKGGVLNVKNGTIQYKHMGNNMEWNGACTIIDITAGGVVNMEGVTVENLGGTDMNFGVHLNNWGEVTLNADNCEFLSTYCGVRVFNSGYDMNNVTITNSKLTGSTRAFWVHNYIGDLNSAQHSDEAIKARLNLDIYNNGNTFEVTGPVSPIRYGFGETVYFNEAGKIVGFSGYDGVGDGLYKKETKYRVTNANGLALINSMMKDKTAGKGITVELWDNIDFSGKTWTPVDSHVDTIFTINEFNGNNYTISNLTINGQAMFKRFANNSDVTFKNVTFDNATVDSNGSINTAIIVVQTYDNLLLENVDVKNSSITGGYKVATLVGTVYNESSSSSVTATLKNCDVTNTTVTATSYDFCTAGLVSFVYVDDNDNIEFENCTISDVKLYAPNVYSAHAAIYTTGSDTLYNEAAGVTVTNVTFENI